MRTMFWMLKERLPVHVLACSIFGRTRKLSDTRVAIARIIYGKHGREMIADDWDSPAPANDREEEAALEERETSAPKVKTAADDWDADSWGNEWGSSGGKGAPASGKSAPKSSAADKKSSSGWGEDEEWGWDQGNKSGASKAKATKSSNNDDDDWGWDESKGNQSSSSTSSKASAAKKGMTLGSSKNNSPATSEKLTLACPASPGACTRKTRHTTLD